MTSPYPIYPAALKKGDRVGIFTPSGWHDMKKLQPALDFLCRYFEVVVHEQAAARHGQFAGTDQQKLDALHGFFKDDNIKAIFCTRGGNGAVHLLDKIDYDLIKKNPKILIGFSDTTILINAIQKMTGLVTFHGPMLVSFGGMIKAECSTDMIKTLMGKISHVDISTDIEIEGNLHGGNLSALQTLIGTPYAPDMGNAILMLEDVNEHLSRYDRMIGHMKQAGWLENLSAIMLGDFINSLDNEARPFGFSIEEIVQNNAPNTPLIAGSPFGHGNTLCTLPIGAKCILKNGRLSFKPLN